MESEGIIWFKTDQIDRDEEYDLIKKAQEGCETSMNRIIRSHARYVAKEASSIARKTKGITVEDIFSAGLEGIYEGVKRFDPDKNEKKINPLSFYSHWIRQKINYYIFHSRTPRIGIPYFLPKSMFLKVKKFPVSGEISSYLDNSHLEYSEKMGIHSILNSPCEAKDQIPFFSDIEEKIETKEKWKMVSEFLLDIPENERKLIERNFGLNGHTPTNLTVLGKENNLTRHGVRYIIQRGLDRIKSQLKKREFIKNEFQNG